MSSAKDRAPAMQFYFRQFAGDEEVMGLDLDAVGAHILLMCAAGASTFGYRLAYDRRKLRALLRNPSEADFERIMDQLTQGPWKITVDNKWIEQHGMMRTLLKQQEFSKKQKANAEQRWKGAKSMPNESQSDTKPIPKVCSSSSSSSSSSSTNINTNNNITLSSQNHVPENEDPELWKNVLERLPTPTEPPQPWQMSNQFINAGRMPMLRYPDLWITPNELASALKIFREKEVPTKLYKQIFEMAQANATTKKGNGVNPDRYSAFLSLTGWVLNEVLKQFNESVKITKNQEIYANQRN